MDIFLQVIIQYVSEIIALVIISIIGILGALVLKKINQSKKFENISEAIATVTLATQETVRCLQQKFVNDWKEKAVDGKLTPEQIEQLKKETLEITLAQLGQPFLDLLAAAKIDVSEIIATAAEAYINQIKQFE